jgi:mannose-6-phosphate isomerase-like protein (cupin superfamily)
MKLSAARQHMEEHSYHAWWYEGLKDDLSIAGCCYNQRYPLAGTASNSLSNFYFFIHEGSGYICIDGVKVAVTAGDMVMVEKGSSYYVQPLIDGELEVILNILPAFDESKHIVTE